MNFSGITFNKNKPTWLSLSVLRCSFLSKFTQFQIFLETRMCEKNLSDNVDAAKASLSEQIQVQQRQRILQAHFYGKKFLVNIDRKRLEQKREEKCLLGVRERESGCVYLCECVSVQSISACA